MKPLDLRQFRSGKLVAISPIKGTRHTKHAWLCQCDCGNTHIVATQLLREHRVQSCGCLHRQPITGSPTLTHGHAPRSGTTSTYNSWENMGQRCNNPKNPDYPRYGGRGITVCERWMTFENFLADMGEKPRGQSIDRINNNGNYEPGNCKWATQREQVRNSSHMRLITCNGETLCFKDWAARLKISPSSLYRRLKRHPIETALLTPRCDYGVKIKP